MYVHNCICAQLRHNYFVACIHFVKQDLAIENMCVCVFVFVVSIPDSKQH